LIDEIAAGGALPVWRRDDNNEALALRITNEGLAAIQADEPPVEVNDASEGNEAADASVPEAAPAPNKKTAASKKSSHPPKPKSRHGRGARQAPAGSPLHRAQSPLGPLHHSFPYIVNSL
jgi:hypothetical protein